MSSFRDEVYGLLFGYVQVWQCKNGKWAAALDPNALGGPTHPAPPGQRVRLADGVYEVYSELDELDGPEPGLAELRRAAFQEGRYKALWAARPHFQDRESAIRMIFGWIRRERPEIIRWCTQEALAGRAWRAAQDRKAAA